MDKPVKFSVEIMSTSFSDDTMKGAYLIAVKWVSTYIISREELKDVTFSFEKVNKAKPTIIVRINTNLTEKDLMDRHCQICRETHKAFFINENCNCAWCNVSAYQRRMLDMLRVKREQYKEIIKRSVERDEVTKNDM